MSLTLSAPATRRPAEVSLRPATLADALSVAAIYNASLRTPPYQPDGTTDAQGAAWLAAEMARIKDLKEPPVRHYTGPMNVAMASLLIAAHVHQQRPLLVAVEDGETVGWTGSIGLHERPGLHTLYEISYYVAPRSRGRGIGSRMVAHVIEHAPSWKVDRLLAMVWSDNAHSLGVLRRAGFETWGALPGAITAFGKRRDMVMLGMILPDATA